MKNYRKELIKFVWKNRVRIKNHFITIEGCRVRDERERGKGEDYFLIEIRNESFYKNGLCPEGVSLTLILIGGGIWKFNYFNSRCSGFISLENYLELIKKEVSK